MSDKVFVDSNIWLYALIDKKDGDFRHDLANQLLEYLNRPVISTQVIREVTVNLLKKHPVAETTIRGLIKTWYADCSVVEANHQHFIKASLLREKHGVSFWDSFILASALDSGCSILYSEDMGHEQRFDNVLTIVNPFVITP